jgi:hypothetical protein
MGLAPHLDTENKKGARGDPSGTKSNRRRRRQIWILFKISPEEDPLGELDGAYKAVLFEGKGWSEEDLRVERIKAVLRPLVDSLEIAASPNANVDSYFDRSDVLLLKRLISSTDFTITKLSYLINSFES